MFLLTGPYLFRNNYLTLILHAMLLYLLPFNNNYVGKQEILHSLCSKIPNCKNAGKANGSKVSALQPLRSTYF